MSQKPTAPLNDFLAVLASAIQQSLRDDREKLAYRRVFDHLPQGEPETSGRQPLRQPACVHLGACYDELDAVGGRMTDIATAFRAIEPMLHWDNQNERRISDDLAERYAEAMIVGPGGVVESDKVELGVSVMAPRTDYPNHRHPPEELYIALSEGRWRQEDGGWNEPGIGGLIYNPANIVHAMRASDKPLFAIWCLPLHQD